MGCIERAKAANDVAFLVIGDIYRDLENGNIEKDEAISRLKKWKVGKEEELVSVWLQGMKKTAC
jgi:hypothetical protein